MYQIPKKIKLNYELFKTICFEMTTKSSSLLRDLCIENMKDS